MTTNESNAPAYHVDGARDYTYLDKQGKPVNGFMLTVTLYEFDEVISVPVPDMKAATARKAIEERLNDRRALADLG